MLGAIVVGLSLGVFGSGGSILTVPTLLYLLHHEDKIAIAESLGIVGAIALISAIPYARDRLVDWRTAILFGLPGMAGTYLGAWVAAFVPGFAQLFVFAAVMLVAAAMMWRRGGGRASPDREPGARSPVSRSAFRIMPEGLGVGALTGFVGVGGGFLIVPALVLIGGLPMRRAVGTSLAIIAMNGATGFATYQHVLDNAGSRVAWDTIGVFIAVGGVGSLVGKRVNARLNQASLQRGFAVFLVAMSLFIIGREGSDLLGPRRPADTTLEPNGGPR